MKTIYKYQLSPAITSHEMSLNAKILCVQIQNDIPYIWAIVDKDCSETENRTFAVYGTGHDMHAYRHKYIGTFQMANGSLVFHAFEIF